MSDETGLDLPPVTPKEDEPRDVLIRELVPVLSEEVQRDLVAVCKADHDGSQTDRQTWENRLVEWDNAYYGVLPTKHMPWPGCSNVHIPLTMLGVETLKPRLIEAVMGSDPMILAVPTESSDIERRDSVELFLNWQGRTRLKLNVVVPESAHLFLLPGTVIAKVYWKADRRRSKAVRSFPTTTALEDIFQALFGATLPTDLKSIGDGEWDGTATGSPSGGPPLEVRLKFKFLETETQVLVDQEVLVENPCVELLDPVDFFTPSRAGADVQKMPWCQHRLWYTEDELRRKVTLGRFDADAVETLIHGTPTGEDTAEGATEAVQSGRSLAEGMDDEASSAREDQYEVFADYRRWDIDEDGLEEEIIVWWASKLPDQILGWDYLENVHATGKRPFVVGRFFPVPFRFYGLSFAEVVQDLQAEINTLHNQRIDFYTIQNLPFYFYRASSAHDATIYRLRPGEGVPINNPSTDIVFPKWSGSTASGMSEEALIYQYFERLTGLTDLALGRQPNRVGATRTATGVTSLLSESGLRFKTAMEAFQRFWVEIFEHILALDQQYLPPGTEFRVTGKLPEFIRLKDRSEIAGSFDLRLAATSDTLNRGVRREDATTILQAIMNPTVIQSGLVGIKGVRRAYADFLKAYGVTDPDSYLEVRQEAMIHTPQEVVAMISAGVEVHPNPQENAMQTLGTLQGYRRDPAVVQALGPNGLRLLEAYILETQQLLQAQQMAQMMAQQQPGGGNGQGPAVAGPQAMNAQTGRQAPQTAPTRTTMPAGPTPGPTGPYAR